MNSVAKNIFASLVASGLLAGSTAFGLTNITIAASTSDPTGDVEIQQLTHETGGDIVWRNGIHVWFGQTFTVTGGGFTLDKISIKVVQENEDDASTGGLTMKMDLWTATAIGDTSGTSLFSGVQDGVTPSFSKATPTWLTFDVPDITLASGVYGFTVDFLYERAYEGSGGTLPGGHAIRNDGVLFAGDAYTDGRGFRLGTTGLGDDDLAFVIQSTIIPEPTTSVLALAGLGLFGLIRRKRS